jgi:hypothetical protein
MTHRIKTTTLMACVLACLGLATLSGCVSSSTSRVTVQEGIKFSKGRELDDLLKAFNADAVTRSEYEELRQIILKRPN